MAKKPTITTVATGYQATDTINDNFTALRDGFDNTISRDGSTPNAMAADLDMGGNDLLNVGTLQVDSIIYGDEPLAVQFGGTGADTAAGARTNLGLGTLATQSGTFSGSFSGSHTGTTSGTNTGDQNTFTTVAVSGQDSVTADSGTDTLTLVAGTGITITTNAATDSITITNTGEGGGGGGGGTIDLATDVTGVLAVANGGTGASTAGDARTSLGLGSIATQNSSSVTITGGSVTGITDLAVADGGTGSSTASGARTNLGLGTMATQASSSVSISGGTVTGITDLAVADGGTGGSTALAARNNLGTKYTITPRQYGATGDGTADDTAEVQAAIDAAVALVGTNNTEGAYVEVDLEGLSYLISDELVITGGTSTYISFCNGKLVAKSSSGVWSPDGTFPTGTGYSTKSMLKIGSGSAKGVIRNVVFECEDVVNGILKDVGSGGGWNIRENEINNINRWGIKSDDGSGGTRFELNWITEKNPSTYTEVTLTGNTSSGSATISGITSTSGVSVGQTVAGLNIPFDARIISKTSTSITLNKNATATSTGATLGVTNYHGIAFWHNNVDDKITGNTFRWCLCPFYADGSGSTALVSNNHFYNGGGAYARWQSRIIYLGNGSNSNIFTGNYLDNGIIEIRGLDQAFFSNRIAATDSNNSEAIFLLVATESNQTLSSKGRFAAFGFELPQANVGADATPLFKFKADPGYSWDSGITNNLVLSDSTHNSIFSHPTQEIVANTNTVIKRLVGAGTQALLAFRDKDTNTATEPYIGADQNALVFGQGSTEAMRINSTQKVQIGNPSLTATDALLQVAVPSATVGAITTQVSTTSGRRHVRFEASGVEAGWISTSAGTTSYNTASDYRLKKDIQSITSASSRVHALNPVRFKWNYIDGSPIVDGFIAHEVQKVVPEAVSGRKDEVNPDGTPIYQAIDPAKLVPLLTAALQEALLRIEILEAKVG